MDLLYDARKVAYVRQTNTMTTTEVAVLPLSDWNSLSKYFDTENASRNSNKMVLVQILTGANK